MAIERAAAAAVAGNGHRRDAQLAGGIDDGVAGQNLDAELARLGQNRLARLLAAVDDGSDGDAGALQVEGGLVGGIIGGIDADLLADGDAEMIEEGARGRGQHDAGAVVVGEHHVALDGAGGDDDAFGANLPEPLARQLPVGLCQMLGDPLASGRRNSGRSNRRRSCAAER